MVIIEEKTNATVKFIQINYCFFVPNDLVEFK